MTTEKESKIGLLSAESVKIIAESIGVSGLANEGASFLAEDITYRLKHLVQEADKVRQHSKRKKMVCADLDAALQVSNVEPVYGVSMSESNTTFRHASGGGREIYFSEEKEVDLQSIINDPFSKIPCQITLKAHWLSIDGVQPTLPENPPPISKENQKQEMLDTSLKRDASNNTPHKRTHAEASSKHHHSKHYHKHKDTVKLKDLTTHELSVEQQFYYKEITESCVGPDELKRSEALQSLQFDPGLHQMLPRFVAFATEGVKINVVQNNLALLIYLMRMVKSLLDNQTIYLDKYLHDLLPTVMTCVVSRQLCLRPDMDNHWALRDFAARLVAQISRNYSNNTNTIQARVTKKFSKAIQCETAALATQYGAIAGLGELGIEVVKSCLLPYICILGNRIKNANEGSALNSVDKVAAEHIKKQLTKYLPAVLKTFHDSNDSLEEFNCMYGYLGSLMFNMYHSKEKSLTAPPSVVHNLAPSRPSLQIPQRPAQIIVQQQAAAAPLTPSASSTSYSSSSSLSLSGSGSRLASVPSSPSVSSSSSAAQKFVIVTTGSRSTLTPSVTPSMIPTLLSNSPRVLNPPLPTHTTHKIVVIQGKSTTTTSSVGSVVTATTTAS